MLGPVLFNLYTTPLSAIISSFDINHHLYADNAQIQMSLLFSNSREDPTLFNGCRSGRQGLAEARNFFSLGPNFSEKNA